MSTLYSVDRNCSKRQLYSLKQQFYYPKNIASVAPVIFVTNFKKFRFVTINFINIFLYKKKDCSYSRATTCGKTFLYKTIILASRGILLSTS